MTFAGMTGSEPPGLNSVFTQSLTNQDNRDRCRTVQVRPVWGGNGPSGRAIENFSSVTDDHDFAAI